MSELHSKVIVIVALARDCATQLSGNIKRIEVLRTFFSRSYVIIVENDSIDGTKEILEDWRKKSSNVHIVSNNYNTITTPSKKNDVVPGMSFSRIEKMVYYRNLYLDTLESIADSIDYLMVIDIDIDSFSINGILKSIQNAPNNWGGLFANGKAKVVLGKIPIANCYYDSYAFVPIGKNAFMLPNNFVLNRRQYIHFHLPFHRYLLCQSAFCGIGIYKYRLIKGKRYIVQKNTLSNSSKLESICEHVPFNLSLVNKGYCNYISKYMCVSYNEKMNFMYFAASFMPSFLFSIYHYLKKHLFNETKKK
ncbi:MAG: hypothetical protein LUI85_03720 [Bacteroides sp.]|nr:hypothetical protein [Bacteroides sp.]